MTVRHKALPTSTDISNQKKILTVFLTGIVAVNKFSKDHI